MTPAFEPGEVALERLPRRVVRARVLETFVVTERFLVIRRRLIDRLCHRAGRRIGRLAAMDRARAEAGLRTECGVAGHHSPPAMNCNMSKRVRMPDTAPLSRTSTAALREASRRVTRSTGSSLPTTGSG